MVGAYDGDKILKIVRRTLELFFEGYSPLQIRRSLLEENVSFEGMNDRRGCFVSLYKGEVLRGCIGDLDGSCSLFDNLIKNAILAAFRDPRFPPLSEDELPVIKIEVSVLSNLVPIHYNSLGELFERIKGKGVVLTYKGASATFLPQVWKQIPNPKDFLTHLAKKAGLSSESYKVANYSVYDVVLFKE